MYCRFDASTKGAGGAPAVLPNARHRTEILFTES